VKVLLIDWKGIVHHELFPRGHTVSGQFYFEVMKHFREAVRRKRPEGWRNKTWMLDQDNTPYPRIFGEARDDSHPPSALLSRFGPCGLFFFPKLKSTLKGLRFQMIEEIDEILL
jgi:hypothetical protein